MVCGSILFGGVCVPDPGSYVFGSYMNDLWMLKDFKWTQIIAKHDTGQQPLWPQARCGHTGTYFPSDDSILVFGGLTAPFGANNKTFVTNELWRYDVKKMKWFDERIGSLSNINSRFHDMGILQLD